MAASHTTSLVLASSPSVATVAMLIQIAVFVGRVCVKQNSFHISRFREMNLCFPTKTSPTDHGASIRTKTPNPCGDTGRNATTREAPTIRPGGSVSERLNQYPRPPRGFDIWIIRELVYLPIMHTPILRTNLLSSPPYPIIANRVTHFRV